LREPASCSATTPATIPAKTAATKPNRKGNNCPIQAVKAATIRQTSKPRVLTKGTKIASRANVAAYSSDQEGGIRPAKQIPAAEKNCQLSQPGMIMPKKYQS